MRAFKPTATLAFARPAMLTAACALTACFSAARLPAVDAKAVAGRSPAAPTHTLMTSRQLWATVDICNAPDKPYTIGIRGSMPGDGHAKDVMYMRFRVQYLDAATKAWAFVSKGADSGLLKVGPASAVTQAGRSFQFAAPKGTPAFMLRGLVTFQWRRGTNVVASASRTTSAGHRSLAGADPPGFSAAVCKLS